MPDRLKGVRKEERNLLLALILLEEEKEHKRLKRIIKEAIIEAYNGGEN